MSDHILNAAVKSICGLKKMDVIGFKQNLICGSMYQLHVLTEAAQRNVVYQNKSHTGRFLKEHWLFWSNNKKV